LIEGEAIRIHLLVYAYNGLDGPDGGTRPAQVEAQMEARSSCAPEHLFTGERQADHHAVRTSCSAVTT
jgi:hypothetical protein